ncbi:LysR family transcriptional regulator [Capsulimonas corticalis]|uniref:LysR family transcriptional regulator n=1 Tax=Capsulimonas corticalis TaxID=2219043 RepID=A0A402CS51_9BACT|nr:LysR family transcriptional regulator [Capsulimonas corticalis]BDI28264.1 LysR family transcriptional regulator [Capsulimonas corticalis]
MNINHLAIFHAVAQEGGIGRGAERLHISQPAVSKQLQELERSLGAPLFDRLPRGVRLTGAGVILADYARRLFALEAEAEEALADLRGLERGTLAVGASMTIGSYLLPEVLARFHRRYPGIVVNLEIANTEEIQQRLLEGAMDLGFTEGFAEEDDLEATVFAKDAMVVIAPPNHPIRAEVPVSAERLCREPFVVREEGSGTRAVIARAFEERGLTIRPAMSLGNIEAIKRAVAAGVGLAVVSSLTIALELETHRVAVVPVSDLAFTRPLHRFVRRGRHQSRAAKALVAELGGEALL